MKNFFKRVQPAGELPKFTFAEAQALMERVKPLYLELEKMNIVHEIHGMGATLDNKTHKPYVFIHFRPDSQIDIKALPQAYDNVDIRYEKRQIAVAC